MEKMGKIEKNDGWIDDELYSKIIAKMPISTVDVVILKEDKCLLIMRENEPAKGEFWTPGGRVKKGQKLYDAATSIVKKETGLHIEPYKILESVEMFFDVSEHGSTNHSISSVILARLKSGKINLDSNHSNYKWQNIFEKNHNPYLERIIDKVRKHE